VIGDSKTACTFKGVQSKTVVCVSRLEQGTSADIVSEYLRDKGVEVFTCYDLPGVNSRHTTSIRLCVPQSQRSKIFDASLWPSGVIVRPWAFKGKQETNEIATSDK